MKPANKHSKIIRAATKVFAKKGFFNVIQGFMDKQEAATIQEQIGEALEDLDKIIAG